MENKGVIKLVGLESGLDLRWEKLTFVVMVLGCVGFLACAVYFLVFGQFGHDVSWHMVGSVACAAVGFVSGILHAHAAGANECARMSAIRFDIE